MRRLLILLCALLAMAGSAALAAYPDRPEGPVLDQADLLPADQETALDTRLREYNQRTGRAVVVVTVNSLDGQTIELYAVKLFEQWVIGGAKTDQGLLLLVAPNERRLKFETGYGLHAIFPDVLAGRIIRDIITPRFKAGDMAGGITAGVDAAIQQIDRDPVEAKAVAEAAAASEAARAKQAGSGDEASAGSVIFWLVLMIFLMSMFGRRRRGYRRSGIDPGIILWGASEIAHHMSDRDGGSFGGGIDFGGGGGGFGGFGGGGSGGGGASGSW